MHVNMPQKYRLASLYYIYSDLSVINGTLEEYHSELQVVAIHKHVKCKLTCQNVFKQDINCFLIWFYLK